MVEEIGHISTISITILHLTMLILTMSITKRLNKRELMVEKHTKMNIAIKRAL